MRCVGFLVIALVGVFVIAARLITDPHGQEANAEFYRSYLITSGLAMVLAWVAAFKGPPDARRPWRWIAVAFTVLVLPQLLAVAVAVRYGELMLPVIMTVLIG